MASFGKKSASILSTCHPDIRRVMNEAIKSSMFDFSVIEGIRSHERQKELYELGVTKAKAGQSPHNYNPSRAIDIVPWPSQFEDPDAMILLAGHMMSTAERMGVELKWGGDWDRDAHLSDNKFDDFPHFELVGWREMCNMGNNR